MSRDSKDKYNPYKDKSLHYTQPSIEEPDIKREGFNDVMKHYDSVNGFQAPKRMEQIPKQIRPILRWYIIISLSLGLGIMLYSFIESLIDAAYSR